MRTPENLERKKSVRMIAMMVLYPLVYQLPKGLLPKPSWVKITQIRTLSTKGIGNYIASISDGDFEQIMSGFNRLCGN